MDPCCHEERARKKKHKTWCGGSGPTAPPWSMERTGIRREKTSHHCSALAHERNVERHARMRCHPTRAPNNHEPRVQEPCLRTSTSTRSDPPRSVQEKRSERSMFLYTTTLDGVGRGISYESSRGANVRHARASIHIAKERNQKLDRIPPPSSPRRRRCVHERTGLWDTQTYTCKDGSTIGTSVSKGAIFTPRSRP